MNYSKLRINIYQLSEQILGKANSRYLLSRKYIKHYRKQDVIFVHIPKSAGTSIAKSIYGARNGHLTAIDIKEKLGHDIFEKKISFGVTRNPYDRLVSAYFYAKQGGSKDGGISNPSFYQKKEFRNFDSFVKEWLVKQDLEGVDPIFRPQKDYLFHHDQQIVNKIFKIERIEEILKFLQETLKREISIPVTNKTKRSRDYLDYYTQDSMDIVNKLYSSDFRLFSYPILRKK